MPETKIQKFKRPTGETLEEISNILIKYIDSIVELDGNSKLIAKDIISNGGKISTDYLQLNTEIATAPSDVGAVYWDTQDKTLTGNMEPSNGGAVKLQIGQEMYIRAVNKTGTTISNGEVVFISGAQGNRPTIELAESGNYTNASRVIGVATEDIANNLYGYVTTEGLVRDLDTSAYTEGDCLFVGTVSGTYTTVTPDFGDAKVKVGIVTKSHNNDGWIKVCVENDKYMFGDVDGGNYAGFESKGFLVGKGEGRFVEDLQFSSSTGKVPASNAPTFETFTTNTKEYAFSVDDFLYLEANEPPHGADFTDTNASWHCHVVNKTANSSGASQYVKIEITMAYAENNGTFDEIVFTGECEIPDGTSALTGKICPVNSGTVDMSTIGLGGQIKPTVKRISATGGTEYADDVYITQIGLHTYQDQAGSRTVSSKL